MIEVLAQYFSAADIIFCVNLLFCLISGFFIGVERESRGKDAGIGTHTLVMTGSMLFTFLSIHVDPMSTSRIAAQVVTGIGFLGAGLILVQGANVKNLTTAASIWFAGAIGMAFGFGFYMVGTIATVASVFIPRIPHLRSFRPGEMAE